MQYFVTSDALASQQTDCIAVGIYNESELSPSAQQLDKASQGQIKRIVDNGDFSGKPGQILFLHNLAEINSPRVLLVGFGKKTKTTENDFNTATSAAIVALNESGAEKAVCSFTDIEVNGRSTAWKARQIACNAETALYKYSQTKSETKAVEKPLLACTISVEQDAADIQKAAEQGAAIGAGMNLARELGNLPGNVCTPTYLAEQAVALGEKYASINTTVLEEADMEALGMGSLLSVSRGSRQPAKLITMEYKGAGDSKPVVLVGKGLTFDAGGISLKPSQGMDEMKYDMCGSASVLGTLQAVAELNLPINVVGVVPSSENMPDGDANKPGDIVISMAGKTIEILNTDAEGRLILCDALTYSERFDPEIVIDIATLTGAIIVALGSTTTGLMANNQQLADDLLKAGNDSFDRAWQLPLWDDYQPLLDSNFADIANVGGKEAGSVTAACFLSRFTEKFTWAHLDIAGTAWNSGKNKGATGRPVPMLVQYLLNRIESNQ
ncbi:leucyl aminopeptidase [Methylophaga sp.]|uniref:leucyl aminopeptidase n=1 Tax=Methylophaga sp. TaxID=2024840 RepID=UPI003A928298